MQRSLGIVAIASMFPVVAMAQHEWPRPELLPVQSSLPDAFVDFAGLPVTGPEHWRAHRRPELIALFEHYVYGVAPVAPSIETRKEAEDSFVLDGLAQLRQIEIRFKDLPENAPRIHLALFLPARRRAPAPVFLALNKCGNQTVVPDEAVLINPRAYLHKECPGSADALRGKDTDFWCVRYLLERGYAFATFHESDIDPDEDNFADGIHPFYPQLNAPREAWWGTIRAWAWGLHRCVDYLVTDPDIDAKRIAVTGHSRRGKTALLAGALDERIALVVPHQSGTGGCALSRDNDQESVERINRVFPHWFNDVFPKFGGNEARLPVDQHLLIALVAPRALLDTEGSLDHWANPPRAFDALREADRVYKFLGAPGMMAEAPLDGKTPLTRGNTGNLAQLRLEAKHTLNQAFWAGILDFADLWLTAP